ncbi:conserved hypothetical protein [Frankia canadensis]|uniref:Uncharacterized protein n=1 Tax=Frankia canadensis TaxID=1836972 RepID=A0A2I2KYH0_9ACTN|nr:hypothetical protein [Frankia canadensis]SNQ50707.1 conserved hypothetical protein [Frankia canadensis]SOU57997.1 conserved hypothetical protein [Frankia canadensis]
MTLGLSVFLIVVGAALRYALTWRLAGIDLPVLGLILMVAGIVIAAICVLRAVLPLPGPGTARDRPPAPTIPPTRPEATDEAATTPRPPDCPDRSPYLDLERRTFGN